MTATLLRGPGLLWQWRGFIASSVGRELQARYARSLLGGVWLILPPLVMIAVYAVVFTHLMRGAGLPDHGPYTYSVFLCAGMLTWQWFSELLTRALAVFTQHAALIRKTTVPWVVLLTCDALVATAGLAIQVLLLVALLLGVGLWPGWSLVAALPVLFVQGLLAVAIGLLLSGFQVLFRDVGLAVPLVLQFLFWLTPIVYPSGILPSALTPWLGWNPLIPIVEAYQSIVVPGYGQIDWLAIGHTALIALAILALALILVRRNLGAIRDEL